MFHATSPDPGTVLYAVPKDGEMTGATRTIVMTGATRGIGRFAAIRMLREVPDLHLVVMTRVAGATTLLDNLALASGNRNVSAVSADLASLSSIREAAATLRTQLDDRTLPPLHGFVGNAGLQFMSQTHVTVDGLEETFAVNVLANHLLIRELTDHFAPPARIVLTTSDTHFGDFAHNAGLVPAPHWDDPERLARPGTFDNADTSAAGGTAYSTSKLGVIYLVHALARRLPSGVSVYSFNPGLVPGTSLARDRGPLARFAFRVVMPALALTPIASRPNVAGANLANAAIGSDPGEPGAYINRTRVEPSSAESYDRAREEELWEVAERLTPGSKSLLPSLASDNATETSSHEKSLMAAVGRNRRASLPGVCSAVRSVAGVLTD